MLSLEWSENSEEPARGDWMEIGQEQYKPWHLHPHKRIILSTWYILPNFMAKFPSHFWEAPIPKGKSISRNKSMLEVQLQGLRAATLESGLAKETGLNANKEDEQQQTRLTRENEMEGGKQDYSGNPQKVVPPGKCANHALK